MKTLKNQIKEFLQELGFTVNYDDNRRKFNSTYMYLYTERDNIAVRVQHYKKVNNVYINVHNIDNWDIHYNKHNVTQKDIKSIKDIIRKIVNNTINYLDN